MSDETTEYIEPPTAEVVDIPTPEEEPSFHTILEVWREVLKPAAGEAIKKVTPQYAGRITAKYRDVTFADMNEFRDRFYAKVLRLAEILDDVIKSDPDCLSYTTPDEDVANNSKHYRTLLLEWQRQLLKWELAWDTTDPFAAVEIGTMGEVHNMFFSQSGLTAHLEMIQFQYTEQDQAEVQEQLRLTAEEGDGE